MTDLVEIKNRQALTTSFIVHRTFNKKHAHVLRDIDELVKKLRIQNWIVKDYFMESEYTNAQNRTYRMVVMTRRGFSLLAMGFTGDKAFRFKVKFIDAFEKMEAALKSFAITRQVGIQTRRGLTDEIRDAGENERMRGHAYSTYSKLGYKLAGIRYQKMADGSNFRDTLLPDQLKRVETIEGMMKLLVGAGKSYTEIKTDLDRIFVKQIEAPC